jgi:hypothetical protein
LKGKEHKKFKITKLRDMDPEARIDKFLGDFEDDDAEEIK